MLVDCAILTEQQVVALEDNAGDPVEIESQLRELLNDSLTVLKAILWRDGLEDLFNADFYARLIGAFELNNLTVEIERYALPTPELV